MGHPVCTAFADIPLWQSPVAGPVQEVVRRLLDWQSLDGPAPAVRDALHDIVNVAGARLHAALGMHGRAQHAADLQRSCDQLLQNANTYAGASEVGDYESLGDLYVRVSRGVDGLIAWLENADHDLRPMLGTAVAAPAVAAATVATAGGTSLTPAHSLPAAIPSSPASGPGAQPATVRRRATSKKAGVGGRPKVDPRTGVICYRGERLKLEINLGFKILAHLARHPGIHFEKREVIAAVWSGVVVQNHVIDVHVSHLRRTLRSQRADRGVWSDLAGRIGRKNNLWRIK